MSVNQPDGHDPVALSQLFLTLNSDDAATGNTAPAAADSEDGVDGDDADEAEYGDDRFDDLDDSEDTERSGGAADSDDNEEDDVDLDVDPADDGEYDLDKVDGYDEYSDADDTGYASPQEAADLFGPLTDPEDGTTPAPDAEKPDTPARFSKPMVIGFVAATAAVAIVVSAAMVAMKPSRTVVSDQASASAPQVAVVAAPAPSTPAAPNTGLDGPIPFQASADCPPGSTAAQAVAGSTPNRAWICVRDGADGQVLTLDLGRPMKITAISIVPGWVGTDNAGADQWLQHRVVTRVTWILINGNQRVAVPQNTGNVHGEAVQQMPGDGPDRGVLASQILMIVQQTSRAPADTPAPSPGPTARAPGGGPLPDILGAPLGGISSTPPSAEAPPIGGGPGADSANGDPADNTFAVSSIKVIGHLPQ